MDNIPGGDWFCYECRNKATGQRNCIVCGKPGNKTSASSVISAQKLIKSQIVSLEPPLAKVKRTFILLESPTGSGKNVGVVRLAGVAANGSRYVSLSLSRA